MTLSTHIQCRVWAHLILSSLYYILLVFAIDQNRSQVLWVHVLSCCEVLIRDSLFDNIQNLNRHALEPGQFAIWDEKIDMSAARVGYIAIRHLETWEAGAKRF